MNVTLNIVIDAFTEYALVNHIPLNENRSYRCVSFLPPSCENMEKDVLYLLDLSKDAEFIKENASLSYLCISSAENISAADVPTDCLLVKNMQSLTELAWVIQSRFTKLQNWERELKDIIINGGTYQDIIDASEYILGNPIQVIDASYKLLASSNNIVSDDEIDVKLNRTGFHSQDTLHKIQESGRLKAYREETGVLINQPGNPNKYGTVSRWFWDAGLPVVHVMMIAKSGSPSPSLIDIFQVMAEHCRMCFARQQMKNPQTGRIYDSLINDLLFGSLTDVIEIDERAKVADMPVTGHFILYKVILRENNEWLIKRVFNELFQLLPESRSVIHDYEIIMLNCYDKDEYKKQSRYDTEKIVPILKAYDAVCGVSALFEKITELPLAFNQAARALSLGETVKDSQILKNTDADTLFSSDSESNIYNYDDLIIYHMISLGYHHLPDIFKNTKCWRIVSKMWKEDKETGNDNSQILFTYLVTERKATRTGELLHMHRNNVIYRIGKIQEMVGVDLDDYWTRFKLLIAFHLLRLEIASGNEPEV